MQTLVSLIYGLLCIGLLRQWGIDLLVKARGHVGCLKMFTDVLVRDFMEKVLVDWFIIVKE